MSANKFTNDGSFMEMFKKQMANKSSHNDNTASVAEAEPEGSNKMTISVSGDGGSLQSPSTSTTSSSSCDQFAANDRLSATIAEDCHSTNTTSELDKPKLKPNLSNLVGKRRGRGLVLKTGTVKKPKVSEQKESKPKGDSFAQYMAEVQKYKSQSCQEEDRTRPLVK